MPEAKSQVPAGFRSGTVTDRQVLSRSTLLVAGRLVSKLSVVVFLVIAARLLSRDQYGIYSYVLVLASSFAIFADPQVTVVAGRDVAAGRRTAQIAYWAAFPVVLGTGMLAAVLLIVVGAVDHGPGTTTGMLLIAGAFVVGNRLLSLGLDMLRALGRFTEEVTVETSGTLLLVAVASLVAAAGGGVSAVLVVFAVHSVLGALVCHLLLREQVGTPATEPGYRRTLMRSGLALSGAAAATAAATRAPLIALGLSATAGVVAGLSVGMRVADAAYLLALTAGQALLPNVAAIRVAEPERALRLVRRAIGLLLVAGAVGAGVLAPFGDELTGTVFGSEYESSGELLSVLVLALPFMGMFWVAWFGLCAYDRERLVLVTTTACAVVTVPMAAGMSLAHGAHGAAWVYVGAITLLAVTTYAALEGVAR